MFNSSKTHCKKYKPDTNLYVAIVLIFSVIRFIPFSCGSASLDDAINDLALGAIASTLVAWLIDISDCRKRNENLAEKTRMIFSEYYTAIIDLCHFIASRCKNSSQPTDYLSLSQWSEKLADATLHPSDTKPISILDHEYDHIAAYVRKIESVLLLLHQQYCMLVDSDIIDADDFKQHASFQINLCIEIGDSIALLKHNRNEKINKIHELLIELEESARAFFPSHIPQTYSWGGHG